MGADLPQNLSYLNEQVRNLRESTGTQSGGGSGGGYGGDTAARVQKLEESAADTRDRLIKIETRLDQTATKNDVTEAINSQIKWMVGTAVVLAGLAITIMTFVLNNASPKSAAAQPQPIVIYAQPPAPQAPVTPNSGHH